MKKKVQQKPTLPNQELVERYLSEVDHILKILGFTESTVEDNSKINDFMIDPEKFPTEQDMINEKAYNASMLDKLSKLAGYKVKDTDLVIKVAKSIHYNI